MALTIVFELVFFGVFLGVPILELLAAYNIFAGELWIVVVVGVLLTPRLVQAASACFAGTAEVYRWPDARRHGVIAQAAAPPDGVRCPGDIGEGEQP